MTSLLRNPPDLVEWRVKLFNISEPIELTAAEFNLYWPYVDNVWSRNAIRPGKRGTCEYHTCRLQRETSLSRPPADPEKRRNRPPPREGGTCQMKVKVVRLMNPADGTQTVRISRTGQCTAHSHDLDVSDKLKRNSVLMGIAQSESSRGYSPAEITAAIRSEGRETGLQRLYDAGGRYFTRSDVKNAIQSRKRRVESPDGLDVIYNERVMSRAEQVREALGQLQARFDAFESKVAEMKLPPKEADSVMKKWLAEFEKATEPLVNATFEELREEARRRAVPEGIDREVVRGT